MCVTCPDGLSSSGLPTALPGPRRMPLRCGTPSPEASKLSGFWGFLMTFFTESHTFSQKRAVFVHPVTKPSLVGWAGCVCGVAKFVAEDWHRNTYRMGSALAYRVGGRAR